MTNGLSAEVAFKADGVYEWVMRRQEQLAENLESYRLDLSLLPLVDPNRLSIKATLSIHGIHIKETQTGFPIAHFP